MCKVLRSKKSKSFLSTLIFVICCPLLGAQTAEKKPVLELSAPLKMELSQGLDPLDPHGSFATESWKLTGGGKSFSFEHSNQAPGFTTGKQFQVLPGGYELARFSSSRKWGSLHAFRTTGHDTRLVAPSLARRFSGLAAEAPKSFLGTRLGAFFLHAAPEKVKATAKSRGSSAPAASQLGLTLARDFKKGFKLESEWSQTPRPVRKSKAGSVRGSQALFVKVSGSVARSETNITVRSQGGDFVNPALPVHQLGRNSLAMDARRTFKKFEVQYARNQDRLRKSAAFPGQSVSHEVVRWSFTPKRWPQMSAAQTWMNQVGTGSRLSEDNLRFGVGKDLKKLKLDVAYLRGTRMDDLTFRPLWERTGIFGDASLELLQGKRLNLHYETSAVNAPSTSALLVSKMLQINTRLSWLKDRFALVPALDYREQRASAGGVPSEFLNLVMTSLIKLPRYVPGTELLVTFSSLRASAIGQPEQNLARVKVQWKFKRH